MAVRPGTGTLSTGMWLLVGGIALVAALAWAATHWLQQDTDVEQLRDTE